MSSPTASAAAPPHAITIADVRAAQSRIAGHAHVTPVLTCRTMDQLASKAVTAAGATATLKDSPASGEAPSVRLFFKCENVQKVGAFKYRGAMNAVQLALATAADPKKLIVVTHSSGNHAQALALAAQELGVRAIIVMPENAPLVKVNAVRGYGGEVVFCGNSQQAREATANEQLAKYGEHAVLVPPFDHPHVMAGQGTLALELLEQTADLDALIVPVGGGGMLAGVCIAAKAVNPNLRIYAAEPRLADDCLQSILHGERVPLPGVTTTVADGLRTSLGFLTYPIIRDHVSGVIAVDETDIVAGMKLVFERMKVVIEPSAGVGVAAALSKEFYAQSTDGTYARDNNPNVVGISAEVACAPLRRVGVVLCGGNVDLDALPWIAKHDTR